VGDLGDTEGGLLVSAPELIRVRSAPTNRVLHSRERTVGILSGSSGRLDELREGIFLAVRDAQLMHDLRCDFEHGKMSRVSTSHRSLSHFGIPVSCLLENLSNLIMVL
jgi:hypothetical protein